MKSESVTYKDKITNCIGELVYDEKETKKRPVVIVAHAWRGLDDFARQKALELANLGYLGFAIDLYGDGKTTTDDKEAAALMKPLFIDRPLLQERIIAAFDFIKDHPLADKARIGAIGFCFGGLAVIELLRTGAPISGVISFHGVLGDTFGDLKANPGERNKKIKGSLLILHGYDDPLVTPNDISDLEQEMTKNGADWQMNIYGNTVHAFMVEGMQKLKQGLAYNAKTQKRAWQSLINFFNEIFG